MTDEIILTVALGKRSYQIIIGEQLDFVQCLKACVSTQQLLLVTNETLYPLYGMPLVSTLNKHFVIDSCVLPDGEMFKTLDSISKIIDSLVGHAHLRSTTLIALGGGVIGDMTGFAAAIYKRGVNFIQIPTSLLAQVDACIGGKTGVNHPCAKNMIGVFYQPQSVFIDVNMLKTLAHREFVAGVAEIIKIALLADIIFLHWLEAHHQDILNKKMAILKEAIKRSCFLKSCIVAADETEQNKRALLNLGHTFAHAIERVLGYGNWLHGEAVGVGLLFAAELSQQRGWLMSEEVAKIKVLLRKFRLPVELPNNICANSLLQAMKLDKKNKDNRFRLVLLKKLGEGTVVDDYSKAELYEFLCTRGAYNE